MRSLALAAALVAVLAPTAAAKTLCVSTHGSGCYHAIQPAVDAARDGDTVLVGPGTFAGGVKVAKSIRLKGSGAATTKIAGGGPVLTLGTFGAGSEPTIAIDGVTVTKGRTTVGPVVPYRAFGGGIFIPPSASNGAGATVTITASAVVGNEVAPSATSDSPSGVQCPDGDCPYAEADGGGIDSAGDLTLDRVVVAGNRAAGSLTSDADGGGIYSHQGQLTIRRSVIADNAATSVPPNGRFAEGGGIFANAGTVAIDSTTFDGNRASLTSTWPSFAGDQLIEMNANSGAIHIGDGLTAAITHVRVTHNSVSAVDPDGEPAAFDAAMLVGASTLTMQDAEFSANDVQATYASSEDVGIGGATIEVDGGGTITGMRLTGNTASGFSRAGVAAVSNGLNVFNFSDDPAQPLVVKDSTIDANRAVARTTSGTALAEGGGVFNNSLLDLRRVAVTRNAVSAFGPTGHAQGGGIWNGAELSGPPVELTLTDVAITRNVLAGAPAIDVAGGGIFTSEPITRTRTVVADNRPDQCAGC
jgi:hypothetical protein